MSTDTHAPAPAQSPQEAVPGAGRLTVEALRTLCGHSIRVLLNWDALTSAPVTLEVLAGREALGALRTVWYATADGAPASFRQPQARQLTVAEAASTPSAWPEKRAARLGAFQAQYRRSTLDGEPVVLTLPVYAAGRLRLLLDSTHRAVAAHRVRGDVRLLLLVVHGPVDPAVLPDLARL